MFYDLFGYSVGEKPEIVQEPSQPGFSISYVARGRTIAPSLLFNWKRRMAEGGNKGGTGRCRRRRVVRGESPREAYPWLERDLGKETSE